MDPVHLVVYSDYLCPWCYVAAVRLRRLEQELGDALRVTWKSYLLRPRPGPRDREAFRAYTRSWSRPAAEPDAPDFRVWRGDAGPPSHSVPPHQAAKAAARIDARGFARLHELLLRAYFEESRDITETETLRALWGEAGLPAAAFASHEDPALLEEIAADHEEAVGFGATGVPACRMADSDVVVVGAQPLAIYRRWIRRMGERAAS